MLDWSYKDWPEVRQNVRKEPRVWIQLKKLIRIERSHPRVSEMFYWEVVQAVLLLGEDTWVLLV